MPQYKDHYTNDAYSTPGGKRECLAIKKRFFAELDHMLIGGSDGMDKMVEQLKLLFAKKPVLAINQFLSGIQNEEAKNLLRRKIYNLNQPKYANTSIIADSDSDLPDSSADISQP